MIKKFQILKILKHILKSLSNELLMILLKTFLEKMFLLKALQIKNLSNTL